MTSATVARTVVGIIGNVASFCIFGAPIPTFMRIYKKTSVEGFKPDPYIGTVMNCIFWVFYGLVTPNSTLVITINGIGLAMQLIYLAIYLYFSKEQRCKILLFLLAEVVVTAAVACLILLVIHSQSKRSLVTGVFSVVFGMGLYASPLTIMKKVIRTQSVEFMTFWLNLACTCNGIIWASYALIKVPPTNRIDWYILTANGVGGILSASQLVLYAMYCGKTPKGGDDPKKPKGEVPLQPV